MYQKRTYTSNDKLQLNYLLWPNLQSRHCVVFLHGFTNDAHIFDTAASKLQQQYNVFALDARGHGDSDWDTKENYTHEALQDDLLVFLKQLPFPNFHLVGHSLGARVAMLLLGRDDDIRARCKSYTIIDTGPEVRAIGVKKVREDAEKTPTHFESEQAFFNYLSNIYLLAENSEIEKMARCGLKEINGVLCPKTDPGFTRALWKPDSQQGNSEDLKFPLNDELWLSLEKITCPTLIMKGQASAILAKRTAEKMLNTLPNAQFETVARAGHALMVDNPSGFIDSLSNFISAVDRS